MGPGPQLSICFQPAHSPALPNPDRQTVQERLGTFARSALSVFLFVDVAVTLAYEIGCHGNRPGA